AKSNGSAQVADAGTGRTLAVLAGHAGDADSQFGAAAFIGRDRFLLTVSGVGQALLWLSPTQSSIGRLSARTAMRRVVFTADGGHAEIAGADGVVRRWDVGTRASGRSVGSPGAA